jgi:hypothetical protein
MFSYPYNNWPLRRLFNMLSATNSPESTRKSYFIADDSPGEFGVNFFRCIREYIMKIVVALNVLTYTIKKAFTHLNNV